MYCTWIFNTALFVIAKNWGQVQKSVPTAGLNVYPQKTGHWLAYGNLDFWKILTLIDKGGAGSLCPNCSSRTSAVLLDHWNLGTCQAQESVWLTPQNPGCRVSNQLPSLSTFTHVVTSCCRNLAACPMWLHWVRMHGSCACCLLDFDLCAFPFSDFAV
jgi:hypothetical protein